MRQAAFWMSGISNPVSDGALMLQVNRTLFLIVLAARLACAAAIENPECVQTGTNSFRITFDGASAKNEVVIYASPRTDRIVSKTPVAKTKSSPVDVTVKEPGRVYFHLKPKTGPTRVVSIRHLPMEASFNFRDLGGYKTTSGKYVRWGLIYRSGRLDGLTEKDYSYLQSIGLKLICDFRMADQYTVGETKWKGSPAPEILHDPIDYTWSANRSQEMQPGRANSGPAPAGGGAPGPGVNPGQPPPGPSQNGAQERGGNPPQGPQGAPGPGSPDNRDQGGPGAGQPIGWLNGATEELAVPFKRIVAGDLPMLFHCNIGRDRTGVFAALLLGVLGVPAETIIQDAELTNVYGAQAPSLSEYIPELQRLGEPPPDLETLRRHVHTNTAPLKAALEMINSKYGSVEGYLLQVIKLTPQEISALRARLLDP
jgi:protein-tyrosine phosphatase